MVRIIALQLTPGEDSLNIQVRTVGSHSLKYVQRMKSTELGRNPRQWLLSTYIQRLLVAKLSTNQSGKEYLVTRIAPLCHIR